MRKSALVVIKPVESKILILRGQKVILDADLAELYGVQVRHLNQQVKRRSERFPRDFRFQLSASELKSLRSQSVISNSRRGGRRYLPYAFTEHGAIMAATVLNSERAVEMSIFVVRAFTRMREALATNQKVLAKLSEIEGRLQDHDTEIEQIIETIRDMMSPPPPNRRQIGFEVPGKNPKAVSKRYLRHQS